LLLDPSNEDPCRSSSETLTNSKLLSHLNNNALLPLLFRPKAKENWAFSENYLQKKIWDKKIYMIEAMTDLHRRDD
jgi:hypothetical protein